MALGSVCDAGEDRAAPPQGRVRRGEAGLAAAAVSLEQSFTFLKSSGSSIPPALDSTRGPCWRYSEALMGICCSSTVRAALFLDVNDASVAGTCLGLENF